MINPTKHNCPLTEARKEIDGLKVKLQEVCKAMGQSNKAIFTLEEKFKHKEIDPRSEEGRFWKDIQNQKEYNINTRKRVLMENK